MGTTVVPLFPTIRPEVPMTRRLTASLIPVVFLCGPAWVSAAAPAPRPTGPMTRPAAPVTRPAAPASKPVAPAARAPAPGSRPAAGGAGKAEPLPTQEELRALYDAGDYTQVLQKMGRVLILKGTAAKAYDRHGLLRLKAESHLRLKQAGAAAAAFDDAAEVAADPNDKAVDLATELLIKRSPNLKFTAKARDKNNPPEPIDIVEAQGRKSAFLSLLEEELTTVAPKVKAARDAKQLAPILPIVTAVKGLRSVEIAANGNDEQTKRLVTDLAGHAHTLVSVAVKDMAKEVDDIYTHANEIIQFETYTADANPLNPRGGARRETNIRKRGLERQTRDSLKGIISTCDKIGPATRELSEAFGDGIKDFKTLRESAEEVGRRAEKVLKDPYQIPKV
jgi:hypothetical protein